MSCYVDDTFEHLHVPLRLIMSDTQTMLSLILVREPNCLELAPSQNIQPMNSLGYLIFFLYEKFIDLFIYPPNIKTLSINSFPFSYP